MTTLFTNELSVSQLRTDEVFGDNGIMAEMFDNYIPREGQRVSIPMVWDAFKENKHVLLEGPCGFGKTFSYLFPAMMMKVEQNKRVVIATSGITLQDQLFKKDVPFMQKVVEKYTGQTVSIGYLKGRNNYICQRKIAEIEFNITNGESTIDRVAFDPLIEFYKSTDTGDKDELDYVPEYKVWAEVASDTDTCEGKDCRFRNECFYYKARANVKSKDILITNYHILLSDIQTNGHLLGPFDILVCDEAHELPGVIRDYWENSVSVSCIRNMQKKLRKLSRRYGDMVDTASLGVLIENARIELEKYQEKLSMNFRQLRAGDTMLLDNTHELRLDGWITVKECFDNITEQCSSVIDFNDFDEEHGSDIVDIYSSIQSVADDVSVGLRVIAGGSFDTIEELEDTVRFIEVNRQGVPELKSKLKKVGKIFEKHFISNQKNEFKTFSVMLTSATIAVDNSFAYIKDQLGVTSEYETLEFIGESPFNLNEQELWYLPPNAKDGNDPNFSIGSMRDLLEVCVMCNGGVLGLFTSISALKNANKYLYENLNTDSEVLSQGDMPREKLIKYFANEKDSILLGTKSLFTGVDVPGDSLRCVFIDKLPFPNISDPVQKALNTEPGAFFKYSIPSMIIDLKQAVGRGVRSVDDKCLIVIADNRMASASYKTKINSSFNYKKSGTRNIDDVEVFMGRR